MKDFFKNAFLTVVKNFLYGWVASIKHVVLKSDLKFSLDRFFPLVEKLTDKNPDNDREALEAFYLGNKSSFADMTLVNAAAIVHKKYGLVSPVATVIINGLIEVADSDGVPITEEIKALFPQLPFFSGAKMLEGQPLASTPRTRNTVVLGEGEKLKRVRRSKAEIEAAKANAAPQGVLPLKTVPPTDVMDANKEAVRADTAKAKTPKQPPKS